MIREALEKKLVTAIAELISAGSLPETARTVRIEVDAPKNPDHGDLMTNFAMVGSKTLGMNPRALAEILAGELGSDTEVFAAVEIAGPGFLNFRLNPAWVAGFVASVLERGVSYSHLTPDQVEKINVEFVSVNPNGPITIGSGRGAAYGSALCNVLEAAGHEVHREYYINDGVNSEQMRLFAESVKALLNGQAVPDNGYKGDYVQEVANGLEHLKGAELATIQKASQDAMIEAQRTALEHFRVNFATWFSEQSLHDAGEVARVIGELESKNVADESPFRTKIETAKGGVVKSVTKEDQAVTNTDDEDASGEGEQATLWLRSTKFGDDQDRVLRRRDGRLTYIASDVAYHKDKFNRPEGGTKLITVLGPDHHGYIGRLTAVVAAMFIDQATPVDDPTPLTEHEEILFGSVEERNRCRGAQAWAKDHLTVQIFQIVRFMKDGKPAPMRKRDGNIYALIDLIKEIGEEMRPNGTEEEKLQAGSDVARFFYLMRNHDTAMDFDLELATKQSDENPVFYVQYAHARICSVIRKGAESGLAASTGHLGLLNHAKETALILQIAELRDEIAQTASDYAVNRLANYALELARSYHSFYDTCRVNQPENPELSSARLALCEATRTALQSVLGLLGVSAPQEM